MLLRTCNKCHDLTLSAACSTDDVRIDEARQAEWPCSAAVNYLALGVAMEVPCCLLCGLASNTEHLQQSNIFVTFVL